MSRKKLSCYFAELILGRRADAVAVLQGDPNHRELRGIVKFYQRREGVLVVAEVSGLSVPEGHCANTVHGFHIHSGISCTGTIEEPFANANGHYNPGGCPHPAHAGDMIPLFATKFGKAWGAFLSDRFTVKEILGRTVILHEKPDDFTSQPSGNAGAMIACGVIKRH